MNLEDRVAQLALSIARCDDVCAAESDKQHPCHKVVKQQIKIRPKEDRHLPEPWFGNLATAQVLAVSSNPSINDDLTDKSELYPVDGWDDGGVAEFFTNRVEERGGYPLVTFNHDVEPNFLTRCIDGEYRSGTKSEKSPQKTWAAIHNRMTEILGSDASPRANYALTEVVHCKSKGAKGVSEASKHCADKWMNQIFEASAARVVVLLGKHVRDDFAHSLPSCTQDFGSAKGYSSMTQIERAQRDMLVENLGGRNRLVLFNFHNGSSEKQKLHEVYGSTVMAWVGKIARGEADIPGDTATLKAVLSALSA